MFSLTSRHMDGFAIGLSMACLMHCLLLPLALTLLPFVGIAWAADETIHRLLLCLAVPTSCVALSMGCQQHQRSPVVWLGSAGLSVLLAGTLFEPWWGETGARAITAAGGLTLAAAHFCNYRLCRHADCSHQPAE